ncbi:hypothetical protein ACLB2K_007293 [Fragaria x ananassa]
MESYMILVHGMIRLESMDLTLEDDNLEFSLNQASIDKASDHNSQEKEVRKLKSLYVGMIFETLNEVGQYYEDYGKHVIQTQKEDDLTEKEEIAENDEVETCDIQIEKKRRRSCSTVKCGCEANMRVLHDKWANRWKVSVFSDIHNHKIVSPARRMMMKSNRHMHDVAKDLTKAFQRENLRISKVPSIFGGAHNIGFENR